MIVCPRCQNEMIKGEAAVRSSLLGALFLGFSGFFWQRVWFYPDDSKYEVKEVLSSGCGKPGWECLKCGAVLIEPERDEWDEEAPQRDDLTCVTKGSDEKSTLV
jgi:hypothetical protein